MNDREVGRYWEANAHAWTLLSRQGWDVYRDLLNTPAFFELLPKVKGLHGLDMGCGEGHNTRILAGLGCRMDAIDVSAPFIGYALQVEQLEPKQIRYAVASAQNLPFPNETFDFVTAFMSLMDMPKPDVALREAQRVLKPGGFFQFSITHPCFDTPHRKMVKDSHGNKHAVEIGRYFERIPGSIDEWTFSAAPAQAKAGLPPFRIPKFHRPLSEWLNEIIAAGLQIERVAEPRADEETAERFPAVADTRIVAYFLHIRCRKPA